MKQVRTQGSLKVARRRFYNDLCWLRLENFLRTPDRIAERIDCSGFSVQMRRDETNGNYARID